MNLIERAKAILLKPEETWPVIDAEPASVGSLYKDWILILAAIPAVCSFVRQSVFGYGSIVWGLEYMVTHYLLSMVGVFLLALLVDALATNFGGVKNQVAALKLVAYSLTSAWVASVLLIVPSFLLSLVVLLAVAYGLYLFWLGVPVLMKCPQEKATVYTIVVVVVAIVVGALASGIYTAIFGFGGFIAHGPRHGDDVTITSPNGQVVIDTAGLDAMSKRVEAAKARMEAAQKSGDPASAGAALGDMMGAITGAGGTPIPVADLKAQLPEALGALKRESFETSGGSAMGISSSVAKATYVAGDQHAELVITDMGGLGGLASVAAWANMTVDKETPEGIEKIYKDNGRTIHEQSRKDGGHAEYTVILKNGVIVAVTGDKVDGDTLKSMAGAVHLDALESMKRPAKS